ncbi:hypothetical protein BUZ37_08535 [Staphylococcus haemolyticus]|nr:hypothetical protein BUZ37_08535 [Staphylococcus haemolyticus]
MRYVNNEKHRHALISQLTENQREILFKYYKYRKKNILINDMYRYSEEWELIDFKVNENYRTSCNDNPLYCECGKELKYQYILRSKSKDTIVKLGIEHFKEHSGIPNRIASQVRKNMFLLDDWLDDVLLNHEKFMNDSEYHRKVINMYKEWNTISELDVEEFNSNSSKPITSKNIELINDFKKYSMALPTNIEQKVFALIDYFHRKKYLAYIEELERERRIQREKEQEALRKERELKRQQLLKEAEARNSQKRKIMAKEKTDKMLIAECRVKITKLLDVQNVIDITTIYNECKIEIDELLKSHVNTKIVNDIVNSINRYTMYTVKFQNNKLFKAWTKRF